VISETSSPATNQRKLSGSTSTSAIAPNGSTTAPATETGA
jgi:hypothetical protein